MNERSYLVPGRECGSCTACCNDLAIVGDGIAKPAGVPCRHLVNGQGCGIYAGRPNVCRVFDCLWRSLDNLGEEWRPDRSGILMQLSQVPPDGEGSFGVDLMLTGPPDVVVSDRFAGLVGGFVESGTATHLQVPPGPGLLAPTMLLNDVLRPAIAARDLAAVKQLILRCYQDLKAQPHVSVAEADIARG